MNFKKTQLSIKKPILPLFVLILFTIFFCSCNNRILKSTEKTLNIELIHLDSIKTLSPTVTAKVVKIQDKHYIYTGGEGTILELNEVSTKGNLTTGDQTKITNKFGGIRGLTTTQIKGKDFLIVGNKAEHSVEIHQINEQGKLRKVSVTPDTDSTYLNQNITIELVKIGKKQFVFVGGLDAGLSCFELLDNGNLRHIQSIKDNSTMFLDGIIGMTTLVIDGKIFLFTGGFIDGGISSFRVFDDGHFENMDNVEDDEQLFLTGVFSLNSTQLNKQNFVLVSHRHKIHYPFYEKEKGLVYHGDGINVFSVNNNGKLTLSSLLKDTETSKLKGSTRIEIIKISKKNAIVLIATRDDKSLQIASLNDKGDLTPIQAYNINYEVYNGMTIKQIDNQWFVFIGSYKNNMLYAYMVNID